MTQKIALKEHNCTQLFVLYKFSFIKTPPTIVLNHYSEYFHNSQYIFSHLYFFKKGWDLYG